MPSFPNHPMRSGPEWEFRSQSAIDDTPQIYSLTPAIGKTSGGTAVTITGFNLVGDGLGLLDVKFDGIAATSIVIVNRQTVTCVTPAGMSVGHVDVTITIRTKTATLPGGFIAWEPTIISITPKYGPISGGTTVDIFGSGFELGASVEFDGVAGTGVVFIDSQHLKATTPAHATGFVAVTVTAP